MTKRVNNSDMWRYTTDRQEFKNHNETAWGEWRDNLYIVYSYGQHFPMYVYDEQADRWYGNRDKFSRTTTRHQTNSQPEGVPIEWTDTKHLMAIILLGGIIDYAVERLSTPEFA